MPLDFLKKFLNFPLGSNPFSLANAAASEPIALKKCLDGVEKKRKKALKKLARDRRSSKGRAYIAPFTEDDKYADDKFYRKKLQECHDKNTKLRRAMGMN